MFFAVDSADAFHAFVPTGSVPVSMYFWPFGLLIKPPPDMARALPAQVAVTEITVPALSFWPVTVFVTVVIVPVANVPVAPVGPCGP